MRSQQAGDALLVQRAIAEALVEAPGTVVVAMTGGVDPTEAAGAQVFRERRKHRGAVPLPLPVRVDRHVIELRDEAPPRRRDRMADDARADDLRVSCGNPDEAQLRTRQEQVQRLP